MPKASTSTSFLLFERLVISLYDGGVLSPAILERVIGAFAEAGIDWRGTPDNHSVDGRSLHEIVAQTMLPGEARKLASASFMTVVAHIAGAEPSAAVEEEAAKKSPSRRSRSKKAAEPEDDADADELLAQLSGSTQTDKRRGASKEKPQAGSAGFNPFVNAALPRGKKA